jgi:hypothetical protein
MIYCTFAEALRELKGEESAENAEQAQILKEKIWQVSRRIDNEMTPERGLYFAPNLATRTMPLSQHRILDQGLNYLPTFPLLEVSAVSVRFQRQVIDKTAQVDLLDNKLYWVGSGAGWQELYHRYGTTAKVVVVGTWGYHHDYTQAWIAVNTLAGAIPDATTTGVTVGGVFGGDPRLIGERYSYGSLIRVDDEMMQVLEVNTSTNELTVVRGVNGSVAINHADGTTVELFEGEDPIRRVTARQSALLYARRGAFEAQQVDAFGITTYPQDLLMELRGTLRSYQNAR